MLIALSALARLVAAYATQQLLPVGMAGNANPARSRTFSPALPSLARAIHAGKCQCVDADFLLFRHGAHAALATCSCEIEDCVRGVVLHFLFVLAFVVGAYVVRRVAVEDLVHYLHDCREPHAAQHLQDQQQCKEVVANIWVPANGPITVVVCLEEVSPGIVAAVRDEGGGVGHGNVVRGSRVGIGEVATGGHVDWRVGVNGPADHHVEDVAGQEPRDDEDAECNVAGGGVAHVFE